MSALPGVEIALRSVSETLNPQSLSSIYMVTGPCSAGPLNTPTRLNGLADCIQFGAGPGIEMAVEIGDTSGWPVFFTRTTTTTVSVIGAVAKTPGAFVAPAQEFFGAVVLPGADHNGSVLFRSLVPGVSLTVVQGLSLGYAASGNDITLTVVAATTTAANIVALALGAAAGLIAAPVLAGDADGTSLCDGAVAKKSFDDGSVIYTGLCATCYLVPGADANGGMMYSSMLSGVSVQQVVSGLSTPASCYRYGNTLIVNLATDGAGASSGTATALAALVNTSDDAKALQISAAPTGTGAGHPSAIAATALTAPQIAQSIPNTSSATLAVSTSGSVITVSDATDANKRPTGTATALLAALPAYLMYVLSAAKVGSGSTLFGPRSAAALTTASTGAVALSGTPNDGLNVQIEIVRGGTPGSSPPLTFRWAVDYLAGTSLTPNWSSETLVPVGGVVALKTAAYDTGLTATFTGIFDPLDLFTAYSTTPTSGATDILTAVQSAINAYDEVGPWGAITGPDPVSKATATLLDAKLQAAFGTTFIQGYWNVRGYALAANETDSAWQTAIITDFQGFVSAHGLMSIGAGEILHASPLSNFQFRRPLVYAIDARKASIPMHESLMRKKSGPLKNVLYIFHNEGKQTGLWTQRFITARTYPRNPGAYYITSSSTMADPSDAGFTTVQWVATACDLARTLFTPAQNLVGDGLEFMGAADTGAVAGALTQQAVSSVEGPLNKLASDLLFTAKTDNKKSASPMPVGQKVVNVSRMNDYGNDRTVNITAGFYPLGETQFVKIGVSVIVP